VELRGVRIHVKKKLKDFSDFILCTMFQCLKQMCIFLVKVDPIIDNEVMVDQRVVECLKEFVNINCILFVE
jgi:hypothetical protein